MLKNVPWTGFAIFLLLTSTYVIAQTPRDNKKAEEAQLARLKTLPIDLLREVQSVAQELLPLENRLSAFETEGKRIQQQARRRQISWKELSQCLDQGTAINADMGRVQKQLDVGPGLFKKKSASHPPTLSIDQNQTYVAWEEGVFDELTRMRILMIKITDETSDAAESRS